MIAVSRALGWPHPEPRIITPVAVPAQALADAAGRYTGFGQSVEVRPNGDKLLATIANGPPPFDLFPQGDDLYVSEEGTAIRFVRDAASNRVTGLMVGGATLQRADDAP